MMFHQNYSNLQKLQECRDHLQNYDNVMRDSFDLRSRTSKHLWCAIDHNEIIADIGFFAPERRTELRNACNDIFGQFNALDNAISAYRDKLENILVQAYTKVRFRAFLDDDYIKAYKASFRLTEERKDVPQDPPPSPFEENTTPTPVSPSSDESSLLPKVLSQYAKKSLLAWLIPFKMTAIMLTV